MSKKVILFLILIVASFIYGKENKIILKKNFIIEDNPGQYYFKYPQKPLLNKDGYIVVRASKQILIFSPDRKFIKNIYKKGEGPGEIKSIIGIWTGDKFLYVFNGSPGKMMIFDYKGNLINEVFYKKNIYKADLFTYADNKFYFTEEDYKNTQKGIAVMKTVVKMFSFDMNGKFSEFKNIQFSKIYYMGPRTIMNMHFIQYNAQNRYKYYISNNGNYDLKLIDLKKGIISPFIKKEYKHIRIKKKWRELTHPLTYKTKKKYIRNVLDDILKIWVINDKIWLFTSMFNEQNIVKVDVYGKDSSFKGSLDFPMPEGLHPVKLSYTPMSFNKNNLYVFNDPESEGHRLESYHIKNIPSWAK